MLIEELIIALSACIIATLGSVLIFTRFYKSPVLEAKFYILGSILFTLYFYSIIPICILNDYSIELFFLKLAPVLANVGLFILSLSILLPTSSTNYKNIFFIIFLTILMTAASIVNFQTITYTISSHNYVIIDYQTPISFLLVITNGLCYVGVLVFRIRNVSKIVHVGPNNISERYVLKFQFYFIYLILISITIFSLIMNRTLEQGTIPGFTWFFPMSLNFLYLGYAIFKDESFLFITPTKLEGILISDNNNGLVIYSKSFMEIEREENDIFANILNAFDISMKSNLQSKKNLEQIIYGDKIILSFNGELVTTFLIVTQNNLVIQSVAKYINNKFEKRFRDNLLEFKETGVVVPHVVNTFEDEIHYIRSFIPL